MSASSSIKQGFMFMALYAVLQSLVWAMVRQLSNELSTETLFFFRNLIGFLTIAPLLTKRGLSLFRTQQFSLHLWRSLAAFIGGVAVFYAVAHAPLATVVAITFSAPIMAGAFAMLIMGEAFTFARLAALLMGFAGVMMVVRPADGAEIGGIAGAVIAALATAAAFLLVKRLSFRENPETMVAYPFLLLLPLSAALAIPNWTTPALTDLPLLIVMGAGFSAAQYSMARAFAAADASAVLPFDFLRLLAASGLGIVFFGEVVDPWVIAGATVILAGSVYAARNERPRPIVKETSA